ncbi:MAG: Dehydrogenase with different specificitity [Chloroflexi bacterium]|jgi:NAD(P)-dependent dehydrogenase (short-subunit alcohol dehydrogenase family)|nr:Dehydrogenase with different specificitity [Chloroflexota bacterium]
MKLFDLTGKVALVVGGHGGIGKAIALGLADAGADVAVASRNLEALRAVAKEIEARGRKSLAASVDIVNEKSVGQMVDDILKVFPSIDILVNAAGLAIRKPADSFPVEDFRKVIDINTTGTFLVSQAVGRIMIKNKTGSIINVSSVRGEYGLPADYAAYCASKGAVNTLTKTLACEWAKHNVRVNAIAPTIVETDLTKPALANPDYAKMMKSRIPMGKWAMPEDTVGATIFFASAASSFITGQILYIDGGVTTW